MIIRDAIERAGNEHEIFFLLAAYVEAVRCGDQLNLLPWQMRDLPLAGTDDIKMRLHSLQLSLQRIASDVGNKDHCLIEEAITVYQAVLRRAAQIHSEDGPPRPAQSGEVRSLPGG